MWQKVLALTVILSVILWLTLPAGAVNLIRDVTYRTVGGVALALDIYLPGTSGLHPAIVFIHGGAWHTGDKRSFAEHAMHFAGLGYVCFSINYRLAPTYTFPAALEDVRCAVRWVREHATDYGVDPARIAAVGSSAGAHLAALLGTAPESLGSCGNPAVPSRVQAVVALFGPMDLTLAAQYQDAAQVVADFLGATYADDPGLWQAASPITWVSPDDPPFLLIHGTADTVVPPEHSQLMADALRNAGMEHALVLIPGAGHGLHRPLTSPSAQRALKAMEVFLARHLGP
jgi:acetyl esterase/lipase